MTRVALIFGGRSAEHDVSILSARSVAAAAPSRFTIIPIAVARDGGFLDPDESAAVLEGREASEFGNRRFSFDSWWRGAHADVVFPLIHGTGGEDGTLQGYLEILGAPYVGSGVAASAVAMDKAHMKHAFASAKLPIVDYVPVLETDWRNERDRIKRTIDNTLRLPYFVKPANGGSSIGVRKVKNDRELNDAMDYAYRFDDKILVERGVDARELEVSVLGNTNNPQTSVAGEIVAGSEFYDYEDKYANDKATLIVPAKLPKEKMDEFRRLAVAAFKTIGASGYARVDFFMERGTNRIYLNEINTIPGFTSMSMYPRMWEATELKYAKLIEKLVDLALERHRERAVKREGAMEWLASARKII